MYNILGWINLLRTCTHTGYATTCNNIHSHTQYNISPENGYLGRVQRCVCVCTLCESGEAQDPKQFALTTSTLNWIKQNLTDTKWHLFQTPLYSFVKIHINVTSFVPSLPLEVGPLNPAGESGEHCQLRKWGMGRPSQNWIWCILTLKYDIWWQRFQWFSWESTYQISCSLNSINANWDHTLISSKQDFSVSLLWI